MKNFVKLIIVFISIIYLVSSSELQAVKIGAVIPLSGEFTLEGRCALRCIEMAIEDAGRSGLTDLELIPYDDSSTVSGALLVTEIIARDNNVIALIGPYNDWCVRAISPLLTKYRLPTITPSSINSIISEMGEYLFRICPNDEYQGRFLGNYAITKGKNIATIYEDNLYGQGLKFFFNDEIKSKGGVLLATIPYSRGVDLSSVIEADIVFIACGPIAMINICDELIRGGNPFKLGSDVMSSQRFKRWASSNASRIEHFTYIDTSKQEVKAFIDRYRARYGELPCDWGILSYDAANLILASLPSANSRQSVKNFLTSLGNEREPIKCITGSISFTPKGDAVRDVSLGKIIEKKAVVQRVTTLEPNIEKPQLPLPDVKEEGESEESLVTEAPEFVAYDESPRVKKMTYPDYLRQRQIECSGILGLTIDTTGSVVDSKLLRSDAPDWIGEIVIEESYKWEFYPAKQRDKVVKVTIAFPFKFQIK